MAKRVEGAETKKSSLKEIGDSGTQILNGIISDEYNSKLSDTRGIEVYDEMRKSDGTVKAALLACTLPIRRAKWWVKPASEDKADIEIAQFVHDALFKYMSITWNDLLRQSLLSLSFGVMVFEKVYEVRTIDGVDRVVWKKMSPRLPKSIYAWQMEDGNDGIQQRKVEGSLVNIPMEKLVVFVHEKEGDNWWGTSVLRAAYKHWFIKNNFYRIDNIAFERQGLGIPFAKMPENAAESERTIAESILKNLRAHHQAYIIEPHDWEFGYKDMMAKTLRDPMPSIQHHNREITKSVLAQFLELGASESGSRALSTDQTDIFLQSLEAVASGHADVLNKYAIMQLVDLNFDNVQNYPELTYTGISRADAEKLANAYSTLITAKGMQAGMRDEAYFRELMGLPERDPEEEPIGTDVPEDTAAHGDNEPMDEEGTDEINDELGMCEYAAGIKQNVYPERNEVAKCIAASISNIEPAHAMALLKRNIAIIENHFSSTHVHNRFYSLVKSELTRELNDVRKKKFEESNDFKGYRRMTFAEKKVDFASIEKNLDRLEDEFDAQTQKLLEEERRKYITALTRAVNREDKNAVKDAVFKVKSAYAKIIRESMKNAYEYGKNNAAKEMGVPSPTNTKQILAQIDIQADAIAELHIAQIQNEAKAKLIEALNKGSSNAAALAAADAAIASKITELTTNTSRIAMAGYINHGRDTVFETNADKIYALQRSELLDSRTCNYCLSIDGRTVDQKDPFTKNTIFHSGCRGIWVEILLNEEELPTIGGIPKSLRDRFGDAVNDLIQPRTPTTNKDSLARKEQEKRLKRQAKRDAEGEA